MLRRILWLGLLIAITGCVLLFPSAFPPQWRAIKIATGFYKDSGTGSRINPYAWTVGKEQGQFKEPKIDSNSPYPIGQTKPAGSNYTRTLVVPKLKDQNTTWIEEELGDMISSGMLDTAIYTMDDPSAPLHPIQNKGHEVMAYLSYIIDFYADLPDVAIFMHAHRFAFHNNMILDEDSALMVRRLSPERVTREGYMNLRCHWNPGCPDWMRPHEVDFQSEKREQQVLAASWSELFPQDPLPDVLAQPCCGQFAVSRERIHAIPRERFLELRDWMLRTELNDFLSGRIFEYTWQVIFTASAFHCPSMSACYCDGYGICFGDAEKFDYYFELEHFRKLYAAELKLVDATPSSGEDDGKEAIDAPSPARQVWLAGEIERLEGEMEQRKAEALVRGMDPRQRAKEAGRAWEEGDGF